MQSKIVIRLAFISSIIVWVLMTFFDVIIMLGNIRDLNPGIPLWLPKIMMVLFVLFVFYYYKFRIERKRTLEFINLLRQVFIVGLPVTTISIGVRIVLYLLGETKFLNNTFFVNIIYHINLGLFLSFLIAAFISWKRLILYQRSKRLVYLWGIFEGALLLALLYDGFTVEVNDYVEKAALVGLGILIVILSINVKWIAYLSTTQKWISLFFILLIFFYLYYFYYTVIYFLSELNIQSPSFVNFIKHPFSLSVFGFVVLYSTFSFFVILFNLPTSSAFEQKLGEVVNLKRISQSVQTEQNEESIYRILLDSTIESTLADAAWIDVKNIVGENRLFAHKLDGEQISAFKKNLQYQTVKTQLKRKFIWSKRTPFHMNHVRIDTFRSVLIFPLIIKDKIAGMLVLLKNLPIGFNKEMVQIVDTFSNQTRISVENFRLLEEALRHERYKEELKIAKKTHDKLLPKTLEQDKDFEVVAFSRSTDEVGGDYHDTIRISENKIALIVADVSGKGITAAFSMAQMKGIFHSLAGQGLHPNDFMLRANEVLVSCLERGTFISAIYFILDTRQKKIYYSRAGHCPILYYCAKSDNAQFLEDKGVALGVLHNARYASLIDVNEIHYEPEDIMLLYTDGITEAKNKTGEEYGYERLQKTLIAVKNQPAKDIQTHLISRLYMYAGTNNVKDDYTTMIIRFKQNSQA